MERLNLNYRCGGEVLTASMHMHVALSSAYSFRCCLRSAGHARLLPVLLVCPFFLSCVDLT